MKRGSKCKQDKELICFGKDKSNSDGFLYYCKECNRENAAKQKQEKAALLFFQMANFASELTKNKETI
jgi:hypothetical protein